MAPCCLFTLDLPFQGILSPKIHIGEYPHVKLETLRVNRILEVEIYEWHGLESSKSVYSVGAWQRFGESFI